MLTLFSLPNKCLRYPITVIVFALDMSIPAESDTLALPKMTFWRRSPDAKMPHLIEDSDEVALYADEAVDIEPGQTRTIATGVNFSFDYESSIVVMVGRDGLWRYCHCTVHNFLINYGKLNHIP